MELNNGVLKRNNSGDGHKVTMPCVRPADVKGEQERKDRKKL